VSALLNDWEGSRLDGRGGRSMANFSARPPLHREHSRVRIDAAVALLQEGVQRR
jgi:hypothetical protein